MLIHLALTFSHLIFVYLCVRLRRAAKMQMCNQVNASVIVISECTVIKTLTSIASFRVLVQGEWPEERTLMAYLTP